MSNSEDKYLAALLAEKEKLFPFRTNLPICAKLLDDEVLRVQKNLGITETPAPLDPLSLVRNVLKHGFLQLQLLLQPIAGIKNDLIVKITEKVYAPVDKFPGFNFVGRILGPRGNSLKRIENKTNCKIMIRGQGSSRDKEKEEENRGKPGFEHLNEPLHVIIEAEFADENEARDAVLKAKEVISKLFVPAEDDDHDFIKKSQLQELKMIKGTQDQTQQAFANTTLIYPPYAAVGGYQYPVGQVPAAHPSMFPPKYGKYPRNHQYSTPYSRGYY